VYGEFDFIDKVLKPLATDTAALGLVDDAAVLTPPPGRDLVLTKDAMVASVHFLADDPPDLIARKLLRVNLSDLAAMGAEPIGYLLALARTRDLDDAWLHRFADGLAQDQAELGIGILGGDTVGTPGPLTLSITAIGSVPRGQALLRSGARPGDVVVVSGTLGDAALGLKSIRGEIAASAFLADRYRLPRPRLALGVALRGLATALIDVSDGLVADLRHVLEASGVEAEVEAARLPLSEAARDLEGALAAALSGGDDYELLFTIPAARADELAALSSRLDLPLTCIGTLREGTGLTVLDREGHPLAVDGGGWTHF
jgi:thiamine-monophosphate kinase